MTSATKVIYGELIWDPVEVLSQFRNPLVLVIGLVSLVSVGDACDEYRRQRGQPGE